MINNRTNPASEDSDDDNDTVATNAAGRQKSNSEEIDYENDTAQLNAEALQQRYDIDQEVRALFSTITSINDRLKSLINTTPTLLSKIGNHSALMDWIFTQVPEFNPDTPQQYNIAISDEDFICDVLGIPFQDHNPWEHPQLIQIHDRVLLCLNNPLHPLNGLLKPEGIFLIASSSPKFATFIAKTPHLVNQLSAAQIENINTRNMAALASTLTTLTKDSPTLATAHTREEVLALLANEIKIRKDFINDLQTIPLSHLDDEQSPSGPQKETPARKYQREKRNVELAITRLETWQTNLKAMLSLEKIHERVKYLERSYLHDNNPDEATFFELQDMTDKLQILPLVNPAISIQYDETESKFKYKIDTNPPAIGNNTSGLHHAAVTLKWVINIRGVRFVTTLDNFLKELSACKDISTTDPVPAFDAMLAEAKKISDFLASFDDVTTADPVPPSSDDMSKEAKEIFERRARLKQSHFKNKSFADVFKDPTLSDIKTTQSEISDRLKKIDRLLKAKYMASKQAITAFIKARGASLNNFIITTPNLLNLVTNELRPWLLEQIPELNPALKEETVIDTTEEAFILHFMGLPYHDLAPSEYDCLKANHDLAMKCLEIPTHPLTRLLTGEGVYALITDKDYLKRFVLKTPHLYKLLSNEQLERLKQNAVPHLQADIEKQLGEFAASQSAEALLTKIKTGLDLRTDLAKILPTINMPSHMSYYKERVKEQNAAQIEKYKKWQADLTQLSAAINKINAVEQKIALEQEENDAIFAKLASMYGTAMYSADKKPIAFSEAEMIDIITELSNIPDCDSAIYLIENEHDHTYSYQIRPDQKEPNLTVKNYLKAREEQIHDILKKKLTANYQAVIEIKNRIINRKIHTNEAITELAKIETANKHTEALLTRINQLYGTSPSPHLPLADLKIIQTQTQHVIKVCDDIRANQAAVAKRKEDAAKRKAEAAERRAAAEAAAVSKTKKAEVVTPIPAATRVDDNVIPPAPKNSKLRFGLKIFGLAFLSLAIPVISWPFVIYFALHARTTYRREQMVKKLDLGSTYKRIAEFVPVTPIISQAPIYIDPSIAEKNTELQNKFVESHIDSFRPGF